MVLYNILKNTFKKCLREPIFYLLLVCCVLIIGLFPSLSLFVFNQQLKMIIDSSMAGIMFFGLFAAILSSENIIFHESYNGSLFLLLSKPVPRWVFILAKIAGILIALSFFVLICNLALLICINIPETQFNLNYTVLYVFYGCIILAALCGGLGNYFFNLSFSSFAINVMFVLLVIQNLLIYLFPIFGIKILSIKELNIIPALILLFFAIWIMGIITVILSTRFNMLINIIISFPLFMLGLISDYLLGKYLNKSILFHSLYTLIPNWQFFWMADAISNKKVIPLEYIAWAFCYTIFYLIFCSIIAILCFRRREIGRYQE